MFFLSFRPKRSGVEKSHTPKDMFYQVFRQDLQDLQD